MIYFSFATEFQFGVYIFLPKFFASLSTGWSSLDGQTTQFEGNSCFVDNAYRTEDKTTNILNFEEKKQNGFMQLNSGIQNTDLSHFKNTTENFTKRIEVNVQHYEETTVRSNFECCLSQFFLQSMPLT